MFSRITGWLSRHIKRSLILISILIAVLDIGFILINYHTSRATLYQTLNSQAQEQKREFGLTLTMAYRNMMQMALYISQNQTLNQLFLEGKKQIEATGDHHSPEAVAARQALLEQVQPAWEQLTKAFDIRQLHYHLGPGSVSFLRVHKPQKFGDRLDDIRPIIVDTNRDLKPRFGFETGRIYSGLRGVYPVQAIDPNTRKKIHVGALESGTSLKQILPTFSGHFNSQIAVLLTKSHVENNMWSEFIKEYFAKNPNLNYYVEATSSPDVTKILTHAMINPTFKTDQIQLLQLGNRYWSVYYFPFFDYKSSRLAKPKPTGFVLLWHDVTLQYHQFRESIFKNIVFALIALIIVEAALIWLFNREARLKKAESDATIDPLTNVYNRRRFDSMITLETLRAKHTDTPLSLIMCDIDHFKLFNDKFGHQAGDDCLKKVSAEIKRQTRRITDDVIRYGGEEFIVLLPNTNKSDAIKIAESIRKAVSMLNLPNPDSPVSGTVSISLGVASTEDHVDSLFKAADDNLYEAKNRGRNQTYPS